MAGRGIMGACALTALLVAAVVSAGPGENLQPSLEPPALLAAAPPDGRPAEVRPAEQTAPPAAEPKRVAVSEEEITRGPADRPQVSLAINVGAGYEPATEVLDVLASRGVRTTFFVLGWWAERNPELLRRIHAEGHEIASHGHSVFDLTRVSDAEVVADLERADAVISAITGNSTRPLWSPSAGYRDARVRRIAAALGYRPILWSQDSGDWRTDATAEQVRRLALLGATPGAIIVMHFDSPRSRSATLPVLGEVIDALRERGLEPVTISELVGE
jgi:peptidoglycan/xylan/chitin deacetylase (PgdA/CDA1 family)